MEDAIELGVHGLGSGRCMMQSLRFLGVSVAPLEPLNLKPRHSLVGIAVSGRSLKVLGV